MTTEERPVSRREKNYSAVRTAALAEHHHKLARLGYHFELGCMGSYRRWWLPRSHR
jgi:hypothetical protein